MCRLRDEIERVAPFSSNVLITGPSGTGKELVARQIHTLGPRRHEHLIPVDCASVSGELMSSQLFGHHQGAFTGATYASLGFFRAADRGTIFLDEIGELDLSLQSKLLRVLQERVVVPVGGHEGVPVDVRVVAATNRNLQQEVAAGRFREDLFFRLNVVAIRTIPLADRPEDIGVLADHFLRQLAREGLPDKRLSPGALEALQHDAWPGNVRQLRNVLEQAVIACDSALITLPWIQDLLAQRAWISAATASPRSPMALGVRPAVAPDDSDPAPGPVSTEPRPWETLESLERGHLIRTLEHTCYNHSAAARLLGISRQALIRKANKHQIPDPPNAGNLDDPGAYASMPLK